MRSFFSYTKTLMEIVGFRSSNFGMDDKATGVSIPVMSSSGMNFLYVSALDLFVTLVSPAKTAAPIEMPFGLRTLVGPGNHVLDGGQISVGRGNFEGGKERPIVKYRNTLRTSVQKRLNRSRCRLGLGFGWSLGITC